MQELNLVGKNLGQYQILEELGQGGMAVVYKAWQSSLRRNVAIKVMLPHLLTDREFVQRFQQEAVVAANLNHPNIVTIYEVSQHEGYFFIVMEYVEGWSLEQLILSEGALGLERGVHILRQVADALDFAHQRQFVHRDIKPANILLTPEKKVVISDFGIAKALKGSGATANLTATGTIIGSPAYMSPEQIIGQDVDYRTDLYSLGLVAYEMFSGRAPFGGGTTAILYAQVNTPPPSIGEVQPDLPPHAVTALGRMLAKQPSERYQTASVFVEVLAGQRQPSAGQAPPLRKTSVLPSDLDDPYVQRSGMAGGTATGGYPPPGMQPGQSSPNDFSEWSKNVDPSSNTASHPKRKSTVWWVLGGGFLLILMAFLGVLVFWVGPSVFDNWPIGQPVAATEESPMVERDRIAFVSERDGNAEIYTMKLDGSSQINLTQSPSEDFWPRWSSDGSKIIFHSYEVNDLGGNAEIYIMDADGKNWTRITRQESADKFPDWSPDGKRIVFASDRDGDYEIYTMSKDGTQIVQLTDNPARDYFPMWSPEGDRIIFESDRDGNKDLYYIDPAGNNLTQITAHPSRDTHGSWFFDRDEIIFTSDRSGQLEIWKIKIDATGLVQLTTQGGFQPRCSPDDTKILLVSNREGNEDIYLMNSDGSNLQRLTQAQERDTNPHWCCLK
jgi:Tol biopolymer transport system component